MTTETIDPEALPPVFPVQVASSVLKIGKNQTYRLIEAGEYPVRVRMIGGRWKVTRYDLLDFLGAGQPSGEDSGYPVPDGRVYLSQLPQSVPAGQVLVHNQVRPTRRLGSRGFRAWLQVPDDRIEVCPCGWAPEPGTHYRVAGVPVRGGK